VSGAAFLGFSAELAAAMVEYTAGMRRVGENALTGRVALETYDGVPSALEGRAYWTHCS
jgi:hypothetical protein